MFHDVENDVGGRMDDDYNCGPTDKYQDDYVDGDQPENEYEVKKKNERKKLETDVTIRSPAPKLLDAPPHPPTHLS